MARAPLYNRGTSTELLYNPFQVQFLEALMSRLPDGHPQFDRLALFAGRRGGKSKIGGIGVVKLAMEKPNQYGWVCAPTYDDLYDFVQPAVFSVIPEAWVKDWVASHKELILVNDTRIAFRSLDDPEKARGPGLDFLWIDEARKIQETAWMTALPALTSNKGIAIVTTSPNGFDWCSLKGTLVRAERGEVPIEELRVGERVWTRNGLRRVTHVTFTGVKPTLKIQVGSRVLYCTAEHKVATLDGWRRAGLLVPTFASDALTRATGPTAVQEVRVHGVVGMPFRAMGPRDLCRDMWRTAKVFSVRDWLKMVRVHAQSIAAQMVQFQPFGNLSLEHAIDQSAGALFLPDAANPTGADQGVADVDALPELSARPVPTAVICLRDERFDPRQVEFEACKVTRVSTGHVGEVYDIGVEGEHEFIANGIVVHNCWSNFWETAEQGEPGFWACKYKTRDNPSMDAREIERARRTMDPLFFQQEFEADFITFTGSIYGGALEQQVLRTPEQIKRVLPEYPTVDLTRKAIIGLDPGADHPFAGVVLVEVPDGLVVISEYSARQRSIREHIDGVLQGISRKTDGQGLTVDRWVMDRTQPQAFLEFNQWGIYPDAAEQADVGAGIRRVQSWLTARKLWFIEPWTEKLLKDLRSYRWAEMKTRQGESGKERPLKKNDDLPDALRYAIMGWPDLPGWMLEDKREGVYNFRRQSGDPDLQWVYDRQAELRKAANPAPVTNLNEFANAGGFEDEQEMTPVETSDIFGNQAGRLYGDDY